MKAMIQSRHLDPRYINIALHVLIWSVVLLLPYVVSNAESGNRIGDLPGSFFTVTAFIHMAILYGNAFYLYPRLLKRHSHSRWLYLPASILVIAASCYLKYGILVIWFPAVQRTPVLYKAILIPSVAVFAGSIFYRRIVDRIRSEREQKERQATQLLTELKFLRSQISPHFLFNVLTNLVSLARQKSDQLEQTLILLADLMRYMLYDAQGKKVALQKEIDYLNSYVALQKLRFGNEVRVESRIVLAEEDSSYLIEPMLLIPFVENAFKHGVGYDEQPLIDIALSVSRGWMHFEVKNGFGDEPVTSREGESGIGLYNVRSRLDLLYKDGYTLNIAKKDNLFHIVLTLKLI